MNEKQVLEQESHDISEVQTPKTRPTREIVLPFVMLGIAMLIGVGVLEWTIKVIYPASTLASHLIKIIVASLLAAAFAYIVMRKQIISFQKISGLIASHRQSQVELEKKVDERTAELIDVNKKLRDEMDQRQKLEEALEQAKKDLKQQLNQQTSEATSSSQQLAQELSDLKKEYHELKKSEVKFRNLLDTIEDGYYEVDLTGNITACNDALCKISGLPREKLMGLNNREYTSPETAKKMYRVFNEVFKTEQPTKEFDWEIVRKNGSKRYVEASVSLVKNSKGQAIGFRGIVRDITERKQTEEKLKSLLYSFGQVWTK